MRLNGRRSRKCHGVRGRNQLRTYELISSMSFEGIWTTVNIQYCQDLDGGQGRKAATNTQPYIWWSSRRQLSPT
jgi:hypothetical protein